MKTNTEFLQNESQTLENTVGEQNLCLICVFLCTDLTEYTPFTSDMPLKACTKTLGYGLLTWLSEDRCEETWKRPSVIHTSKNICNRV